MIKSLRLMALLGCVAAAALASPCAQAQAKHDSNTLHKVGKAIAYPVRKAGQNTSITVHRAIGHNSVVHRHQGSHHYKAVETPSGNLHPIRHSTSMASHTKSRHRSTTHHRSTRRHHSKTSHQRPSYMTGHAS